MRVCTKLVLIRAVNFASSKNLTIKSTRTSPDEKIGNYFHHTLIDWRWNSSIVDVQLFRAADCDTDHCLVVAFIRYQRGKNGSTMRQYISYS
jgi:hypothetical protein